MDPYLLAPELSLTGLALALILLDLVVKRKGVLAGFAVLGLLVPLVFSILLWGERGTSFANILIVDEFSLFFKFLLLGVAAAVILSSVDYVAKFRALQGEFYALILLSTAGMMLVAATQELITIFVSLELVSVCLYVLAGFLRDPKSSEASLKYLLLGAVAAAVMVYGMALVFGLTGTTYLDQIAVSLRGTDLAQSPALIVGIVFIAVGFGFKVAAVPFQAWVPDVYQGAPTPVTAYLSVASKAAGFAVILRVFYLAFGDFTTDWSMVFAILSAVSMALGNLVAIQQTDIKRFLGYSSIAQAGFIMIGLATIGEEGASRVLFYLGAYAFTNLAAFIAIIAISNKINSDRIDDYAGMVRRAPVLAICLALAMISLIGIPPTAGFWAKVLLFQSAVGAGLGWLVILGVINSVVSAYYYLRVVKVMFLQAPPTGERIGASPPVWASVAVATLGIVTFGVVPGLLLRLAESAARSFRG
ncbi:MAG: NADH-quinone oxidoreductase subunit N [Dehalococcoidia bacterium]|nr:NADH-quinone oxidoreductase subunit N [Dehalococcoidia bacterium]